MITAVVREALALAASAGVRMLTLPALATGYGRLTVDEFARGLRPLVETPAGGVEEVRVCLRDADAAEVVRQALASA